QAEDGIRDRNVTGVQTCALPIFALLLVGCEVFAPTELEEYELLDGPIDGLSHAESRRFVAGDVAFNDQIFTAETGLGPVFTGTRSEERRVGKESRDG